MSINTKHVFIKSAILLIAVAFVIGMYVYTNESSAADDTYIKELQDKISERGNEIGELKEEIKKYEEDISELNREASTLTGTIKTLDATRKKLLADISVTENEIDATSFAIEKVEFEISKKEKEIGTNNRTMADIIRKLNEVEAQSLVEVVLSNDSLSEFWDDINSLQTFQETVRDNLKELESLRDELNVIKDKRESEKESLVVSKEELGDQKQIVEANKNEKSRVLKVTKNKESEFQKTLEEKRKLKEAFEAELEEFESQLKVAIDPSQLPAKGSGVLRWPLDSVRITQYFGDTDFAKSGAYKGKGHNGIDMGAAPGTKVKSAAGGVVTAVGDTDAVCPYASYGKWALIDHKNGLSTLYAHLSLTKVGKGQTLNRGDLVGYSGSTGYSTGPHLHFTVYATKGVQVSKLKSRVCGGTYTIPLAPLNAYLNPINYLTNKP